MFVKQMSGDQFGAHFVALVASVVVILVTVLLFVVLVAVGGLLLTH